MSTYNRKTPVKKSDVKNTPIASLLQAASVTGQAYVAAAREQFQKHTTIFCSSIRPRINADMMVHCRNGCRGQNELPAQCRIVNISSQQLKVQHRNTL